MWIGRCLVALVLVICITRVTSECTSITDCNECNDPPFECIACQGDESVWRFSSDKTKCYECTPYCTKSGCSATNEAATCSACESGHFAKENVCNNCPGLCDTCTGELQCTTCKDGAHKMVATETEKIICEGCEINCDLCGSTTDCWKCYEGWYLYMDVVNEGSCAVCATNCQACTKAEQCTTCDPRYKWDNDKKYCVPCIDNCEECDTNSGCTKCYNGWSLKGGECLPCTHCVDNACGVTGGCTTCETGYYAVNADGMTCTACDHDYCYECDSVGQCTTCDPRYLLNEETDIDLCIECPDLQTRSECEECQLERRARYFDSVDSTCWWCPADCISCTSPTTCTFCATGYYEETSASGVDTCNSCEVMANCAACSSGTVCTSCSSGYYKSAADTCSACSVMTGCLTCSSATVCSACEAGMYAETSSTCTACTVSNCATCTAVDQCSSCDADYYLMDDTCVACTSSFGDVNTYAACVSQCGFEADPGYYYVSGCEECPDNCLICIVSGIDLDFVTSCTDCMDGYYEDSGDCTECDTSQCMTCDGGDNGATCTACMDGYELDSNLCYTDGCADGQGADGDGSANCDDCDSSCVTCTIAGETDKCTECWYGTFLSVTAGSDPEHGTCTPCVDPCKTCSGATSTECLTCANDQFLSSGSCSDCDGTCKECSADGPTGCTSCNMGDHLNDANGDGVGSCDNCADDNCVTCTDTDVCQSCRRHSQESPDGADCFECDVTCETCDTDSATCVSCYDGWVLISDACQPCDATAGCANCTGTTDGCDAVLPGFTAADTHYDCTLEVDDCTGVDGCFDAGCIACDGSCATCEGTTDSDCDTCYTNNGMFLNGTAPTTCDCCPAGCANCTYNNAYDDDVECTVCEDGWAMDTTTGHCGRCDPSCDSCAEPADATNCTTCHTQNTDAYVLSGSPGTCVRTGTATFCNGTFDSCGQDGCYGNETHCYECDDSCATLR